MKFSIPVTTSIGSLLVTQASGASFELFNAHNCEGFFVVALQPASTIGCTSIPLDGETALSAHFIDPPADNCFLSFYSDESCNTPQAIVDSIGGGAACVDFNSAAISYDQDCVG